MQNQDGHRRDSAVATRTRPGIHHIELGVRDLERSTDFYGGVLGLPEVPAPLPTPSGGRWFDAGTALLTLVPVNGLGSSGAWRNDDLQAGVRHLGFKVGDVDTAVADVEGAGLTVLSAPANVVGDVRIAFFLDPDGTRLEFVQGTLSYQEVSTPSLAEAEAARTLAAGDPYRFDHVAVTVDNLAAATHFYRDGLGWREIGNIRHRDDERGFLMSYLQAGSAAMEVFSFDVTTSPSPWTSDPGLLGVRAVGVTMDHRRGARPIGIPVEPALGVSADVLSPDGCPLAWVDHS